MLRFARLLRTWCTRGQIARTERQLQRPDLHKRAPRVMAAEVGGSPDLVDLWADPSLIGTEKR